MNNDKIGIGIKINGIFALTVVGFVCYQYGKKRATDKIKYEQAVKEAARNFVREQFVDCE